MRLATFAVLGLAFALPVTAAAQEPRQPPAPTTAPAYEFQCEGLFVGVIYSVMRHAGMEVQLTIGVGEKSFEVVVAPMDWLDAKHVVFRPGERIEIVGARGDRGSASHIVAREIYTADQTIVLRDNQGQPLWE